MKFNISPGIIISLLGIGGLMYAFVDKTGTFGSKIPIVAFFIIIIIIGLLFETFKNKLSEIFGEVGSSPEYA